jgi:hypothetical protein
MKIRTIVTLLILALAATACGTESGAFGDGNATDDTSLDQPDSQIGSPGNGDEAIQWTRIDPTYGLVDPHIGFVQEVVVDPDDDRLLLVRFFGGVPECYGANAMLVSQTADEIVVLLEVGLTPTDDEGRMCIEIALAQELTVELAEPAGGAALRAVDADAPLAYVGLGLEAAIDRAEAESRDWRLASQDGEHFALTMDYRPERINFDVVDGIVTNAWLG